MAMISASNLVALGQMSRLEHVDVGEHAEGLVHEAVVLVVPAVHGARALARFPGGVLLGGHGPERVEDLGAGSSLLGKATVHGEAAIVGEGAHGADSLAGVHAPLGRMLAARYTASMIAMLATASCGRGQCGLTSENCVTERVQLVGVGGPSGRDLETPGATRPDGQPAGVLGRDRVEHPQLAPVAHGPGGQMEKGRRPHRAVHRSGVPARELQLGRHGPVDVGPVELGRGRDRPTVPPGRASGPCGPHRSPCPSSPRRPGRTGT